jgi:hypothetical protein
MMAAVAVVGLTVRMAMMTVTAASDAERQDEAGSDDEQKDGLADESRNGAHGYLPAYGEPHGREPLRGTLTGKDTPHRQRLAPSRMIPQKKMIIRRF